MVGRIWGQTRNLSKRTFGPVYLTWGQTRCPIYRSGTFNVKRSTLNFQRGDRKGAWWFGYGDRHGIWTTGLLTRRTCPSTGRVVQAGGVHRCGDRHDVRYTNHERSTHKVQLSTFNGVTEMAQGGRNMGTDTEFGRPDFWPGGPDQASVGRSKLAVAPKYRDRHDVRYTDQERSK